MTSSWVVVKSQELGGEYLIILFSSVHSTPLQPVVSSLNSLPSEDILLSEQGNHIIHLI
jgi:hypothetical protein